MKKRIASMLICVMLVFTLLPIPAYAAERLNEADAADIWIGKDHILEHNTWEEELTITFPWGTSTSLIPNSEVLYPETMPDGVALTYNQYSKEATLTLTNKSITMNNDYQHWIGSYMAAIHATGLNQLNIVLVGENTFNISGGNGNQTLGVIRTDSPLTISGTGTITGTTYSSKNASLIYSKGATVCESATVNLSIPDQEVLDRASGFSGLLTVRDDASVTIDMKTYNTVDASGVENLKMEGGTLNINLSAGRVGGESHVQGIRFNFNFQGGTATIKAVNQYLDEHFNSSQTKVDDSITLAKGTTVTGSTDMSDSNATTWSLLHNWSYTNTGSTLSVRCTAGHDCDYTEAAALASITAENQSFQTVQSSGYTGATLTKNEELLTKFKASCGDILYYKEGESEPCSINAVGKYHADVIVTLEDGTTHTISDAFSIRTPAATPNAVFTATGPDSGILSDVEAGMTYSFDGSSYTDITSSDAIILENLSLGTIYVNRKGDGILTEDSAPQEIQVSKAAKPENLTVTQPAIIGGTGSIATTASHEYSADGEAYTAYTGALNDLAVGTYYVRKKASGTSLASDAVQYTINAYMPLKEATPEAIFAAPDKLTGLAAGADYTITVDGGEHSYTADQDGTITIDTAWYGKSISIVKKTSDSTTHIDSDAQTLNIPHFYKLTYNGAEQALVHAGVTDAGIPMEYALSTPALVVPATGWSTDIPTGKNVGTYYACYRPQNGGADSLGFVIVVIGQKEITITADDKEVYVGSKQPELTYTVDGLSGSDQLTTAPTLTTDADMNRTGNYTITASGADAGSNYTISYVNGTLTIERYPRGSSISSTPTYPPVVDGDDSGDVTSNETDTTCPRDRTCPMYGYTDLDMTAWYHDGIHFCIENGLMQGIGNNQFNPNGTTTRAMIVTILWRLEGSPVVNYLMDFEDVAADRWYTEAIRWAASDKIVEGYGNGSFGANDAITREQMATIMHRYAKYKGYDVSVGEDTDILSYGDALDVAEWAIPAMQWACGSGLITGIESGNITNLEPRGNATRAQAATILYRFCGNITKNTYLRP